KLEIDPEGLERTVVAFNQAVQPGEFNPAILDGKATRGLTPPKSNWALPLDAPPYLGYAVTCGITFTFGGLRVDTRARVLDTEDRVIPGLYAAGELLGGLFYHNYPGGAGLMAGAVFGRLAGESAAADLGGAPPPCASRLRHHPPPVDAEDLARDVVRGRRGEEDDRLGDILRRPQARDGPPV